VKERATTRCIHIDSLVPRTHSGGVMGLLRRRFLQLAAGAAALPAASRIARAQAYPTRPVRMIVPFAPGGPTDVCARLIAQKLSEHLGKQFYVENVAGAGGNIGTGQAARAVADEYSILITVNSHVINPTLYDKLPYNAFKDFKAVTLAAAFASALSVSAGKYHQGSRHPHQRESRQIQLRITGAWNAVPPLRRTIPCRGRPRPRACSLWRKRPGHHLGGRGPHTDC
jgi:hypothetical protein